MSITIHSTDNHHYIKHTGKPLSGMISIASLILINQLMEDSKGAKYWRKKRELYMLTYKLGDDSSGKSIALNYRTISKFIRENGEFDPVSFKLPINHSQMACHWMDAKLELGFGFHMSDSSKTDGLGMMDGTPGSQFGEDYPIKPKLDREGQILTTLQPQLFNRIISKRLELINNSNNALRPDWALDLRVIINDVISLLEITLNQLYIKAKYSKLPHWNFDEDILGNKHGRRFNEKLKWVRQISGKNLNIESERKSLDTLREVRNHFNHFDPPSLVITIEEATNWLNQIIDVGIILVKIRQTLGVRISVDLLNFTLQKEATFHPVNLTKSRTPLNSKINGYKSSTW